jgi:hypothetical protein
MEQHPQWVVLEALEAPTGPLDLLHAQVEALGRTVEGPGAVVVQDLGSPASKRVVQGEDLVHLVVLAPGDRLVQKRRGVGQVVGEVDVAH